MDLKHTYTCMHALISNFIFSKYLLPKYSKPWLDFLICVFSNSTSRVKMAMLMDLKHTYMIIPHACMHACTDKHIHRFFYLFFQTIQSNYWVSWSVIFKFKFKVENGDTDLDIYITMITWTMTCCIHKTLNCSGSGCHLVFKWLIRFHVWIWFLSLRI